MLYFIEQNNDFYDFMQDTSICIQRSLLKQSNFDIVKVI